MISTQTKSFSDPYRHIFFVQRYSEIRLPTSDCLSENLDRSHRRGGAGGLVAGGRYFPPRWGGGQAWVVAANPDDEGGGWGRYLARYMARGGCADGAGGGEEVARARG